MSEQETYAAALARWEADSERWRAALASSQEETLTRRDYFAGQALAAVIQIGQSLGSLNPEELSIDAYRFADAMLKERSK